MKGPLRFEVRRLAERKAWEHFVAAERLPRGSMAWLGENLWENLWDLVEAVANATLRLPHKHYVIDDHCMRPEHRFCVFCHRKTPFAKVNEP